MSHLTTREKWPDVAKGLGIILVVIAHVAKDQPNQIFNTIAYLIFLFHMPLFFLISGYFYKRCEIYYFLRARFSGIMIPYVAFILLIFLLDAAIAPIAGTTPQVWSVKSAAAIALGGSFATEKYGVLWFIPCLFSVGLIFVIVEPRGRATLAVVVAFFLAIAFILERYAPTLKTPFGIAQIPAAFIFFASGATFRVLGLWGKEARYFILFTLLICAAAFALGENFRFDMKDNDYGPPVLGIMLGVALSLLAIRICDIASKRVGTGLLALVGVYSFTIMMLHQFVHFSMRSLGLTEFFTIATASILFPLGVSLLMAQNRLATKIFLGRRVAVGRE